MGVNLCVKFKFKYFQQVNLSTNAKAKNTVKESLPSSCTNKPIEYDVKNFNGTVLIELKDKEVIPIDVGHQIGKVIVRVGNERRVHFNLDGNTAKKTAVLTLKKYSGNVILRGGDQRVDMESNSAEQPVGPHHVGLIYI